MNPKTEITPTIIAAIAHAKRFKISVEFTFQNTTIIVNEHSKANTVHQEFLNGTAIQTPFPMQPLREIQPTIIAAVTHARKSRQRVRFTFQGITITVNEESTANVAYDRFIKYCNAQK